MNKTAFLFILITCFSSKPKEWDCSTNFKLANKTKKQIVLFVLQKNPLDSLYLGKYGYDSTGFISLTAPSYTCMNNTFTETLYYLDDTSYLSFQGDDWGLFWHNGGDKTREDSLRFESCYYDPDADEQVMTITVTDTLLTIFKKDYTMLEKFKEYYQK